MKATAWVLTAVLMMAIAWIPAATQDRQVLFEKALAPEGAQGKLREAIALYQKIVDESKDHALAAQAQLRIGICHQKLGHKDAQTAFQKVIENYPDQAETVRPALFSSSEFAWFQKRPMLWSRVGGSVIYAGRGCLRARELKSGQERELYCYPNFAPLSAMSPGASGRGLSGAAGPGIASRRARA